MGTYCLSGDGVQPCPAGHYCLGGGVAGILPCPPGTYNPQFGLSQMQQCLICPAGGAIIIHVFTDIDPEDENSSFYIEKRKLILVKIKIFLFL